MLTAQEQFRPFMDKIRWSVVGITVTAFDEASLEVDEAASRSIIARAYSQGLRVITPNGNTSEFYSLSAQERCELVAMVRQEAPEALIVGGVGHEVSVMIDDIARHLKAGADAFMVHHPVHPFWSVQGWVDLHRQVADAHPGVPLVPYIKDRRITADAIVQLLETVPEVVAIKYAIPDLEAFSYATAAVEPDRVVWICGLAENWAPFFDVAGAEGFTSGLVNVDPGRSMRMLEALRRGDYGAAMREQHEILTFEGLRARNFSEFNVSAVKEALHQQGMCSNVVRPPLSMLSSKDRELVSEILVSWAEGISDTEQNLLEPELYRASAL